MIAKKNRNERMPILLERINEKKEQFLKGGEEEFLSFKRNTINK